MKDIMLKIVGRQNSSEFAESASEDIEFITEGRFYQKGESFYLIYDESDFSGMDGYTTSLKITADKVKMRRYGEDADMETSIEFEQGKRFNGIYETPYGAVEMEVLTNEIKSSINSDGAGSLDIDYHISLKGLSEGRNSLKIEIMQ